MSVDALDILAIGAHPDDVELAIAGTLWQQAQLGQRVGILDLTRGEMGTRGTPEIRHEEAQAAGEVIGLAMRDNAGFDDAFFKHDDQHIEALVRYIRRWRPKQLIINAPDDRHPDHGRAHRLCKDAWFMAGLQKLSTEWEGEPQQPHRPEQLLWYIQDLYFEPTVIVRLSEAAFEKKMEAVRAHKSQFYDPSSTDPDTYIASKDFLHFIEARARHFGHLVGASYGEGLITQRTPGVNDLGDLLSR